MEQRNYIKLTQFFLKLVLFFSVIPTADASVLWSTEAHWSLIRSSFGIERADCLSKMKEGSEWVDGLMNQLPSRSFMHAMRSGSDQKIEVAKHAMADFIQSHYELAAGYESKALKDVLGSIDDPLVEYTHDGKMIVNHDDYLNYCYERGVALHPVMDSISPAHAGFAIWSLSDISEVFKHGDLPGSIENEQSLLAQPDLMNKTVGLSQIIDRVYLEFKMKDFRYE